jgi:K+-sensing histidine kinase KdpD
MKAFGKKFVLFLAFSCMILLTTGVASHLNGIANRATVGFSFLIPVVISAVFAGLTVAVATSVVATLCYNYFFLPPVGAWNIANIDDWIALFAFLFTAIVISRVTASSQENSLKSQSLDLGLKRLNEFGSWLMSVPRELITLSTIAEGAVRIFFLEYCSIHVYAAGKWHHFSGNATRTSSGHSSPLLSIDRLQWDEDHPTSLIELIEENALGVRYSKITNGSETSALLVVKSATLSPLIIDSMAVMIGVLLTEILPEHT